MRHFFSAVLVTVFVAGYSTPVRASDDKDTKAILDKAIEALGGKKKLGKIKAASWKGKGTIALFGEDNEMAVQWVVQGLNHVRQEFEGEFNGNKVKRVTILAGDKGWQKMGETDPEELEGDALASEKHMAALQWISMTILPLKKKGFKLESAKEVNVDGKPAAGIKVTAPDGKKFSIFFDKGSGLPVKLIAKGSFMGQESTMETTYRNYKNIDGIKRPMKIEIKKDGEKFIDQEISDFKILDKVAPDTFAKPE